MITTKSGKSGATKVSLNFYQGVQSAYKTPEALNAEEYASAYRGAAAHAGAVPQAAHDPLLNPWSQVTRTNWMDEIFQAGPITNANLQLSGGSKRGRFSTSFGYHKKEGILRNTDFELFSFRLKSEYDLTDKLRIGQNVYVNHSTSQGVNTSSSYSGAIINAIYMNPAAPVYDEFGHFHGTVPFELSQFAGAYGDTYNPVSLLLRPNIKNPRLNINAIAYAEYDILENLTFKSSFSMDLWSWTDKNFSPRAPEIGRPSNMNFLNQGAGNSSRWIWDQQLNYNKSFHNTRGLILRNDPDPHSGVPNNFSSEYVFSTVSSNERGQILPGVMLENTGWGLYNGWGTFSPTLELYNAFEEGDHRKKATLSEFGDSFTFLGNPRRYYSGNSWTGIQINKYMHPYRFPEEVHLNPNGNYVTTN
ncbi:MAG TPA: hypothetical protein VK957_22450 [Lunatimonas sp.]|nr:hypothetical protein [Lunatimonas sp.]